MMHVNVSQNVYIMTAFEHGKWCGYWRERVQQVLKWCGASLEVI